MGISWQELIVILLIVLVLFGPKRLPEIGSSLGRGIRGFKDSMSGREQLESSVAAASTQQVDAATTPAATSATAPSPAPAATPEPLEVVDADQQR